MKTLAQKQGGQVTENEKIFILYIYRIKAIDCHLCINTDMKLHNLHLNRLSNHLHTVKNVGWTQLSTIRQVNTIFHS